MTGVATAAWGGEGAVQADVALKAKVGGVEEDVGVEEAGQRTPSTEDSG